MQISGVHSFAPQQLSQVGFVGLSDRSNPRDAQHRPDLSSLPYSLCSFVSNHALVSNRRSLVRKLTLAVAFAALWTLSGCKKTGEGQYEVQKPVVGTEKDTVNTPSVETGTVKDTINVPKVETEKKEVTLPKVDVKKPKE
jgi:hypothetical protein